MQGSIKSTHFPVLVLLSTSEKVRKWVKANSWVHLRLPSKARWSLTRHFALATKLDERSVGTPFKKFTSIHFEHSYTHDEDHKGGNELKYGYEAVSQIY